MKNYATLPGDAEKLELLAQEFKNEIINAQMNCNEISRTGNEVRLKIGLNSF